MLAFWLVLRPLHFNRLATAIHWILQNNYNVQFLLHYLDDFLTAGPPDSPVCQQNLESMLTLCQRINAPVKEEKVVPPSTKITFLGIVIDTVAMTASISDERKSLMLEELQSFTTHKKCTKLQLLSLIGKLSFACKVVPAGRIFLRCLINLSMTVQRFHHHIRISQEARLDIIWWLDFLPTWPGSSLILDHEPLYRRLRIRGLGCLLVWLVATGRLVTSSVGQTNLLEGTICCCKRRKHIGPSMGQAEDTASLRQQGSCGDLVQGLNV